MAYGRSLLVKEQRKGRWTRRQCSVKAGMPREGIVLQDWRPVVRLFACGSRERLAESRWLRSRRGIQVEDRKRQAFPGLQAEAMPSAAAPAPVSTNASHLLKLTTILTDNSWRKSCSTPESQEDVFVDVTAAVSASTTIRAQGLGWTEAIESAANSRRFDRNMKGESISMIWSARLQACLS